MVPILPASSSSDTHGVFALLEVLTNPEAVKTRLAELVEQTKPVMEALEESRRLHEFGTKAKDEAIAIRESAEKLAADAKAQMAEAVATLRSFRDRETAFAQREVHHNAVVTRVTNELDTAKATLEAKTEAFEKRLVEFASKEHALRVERQTVDELRVKLEGRLAELRAAAERFRS